MSYIYRLIEEGEHQQQDFKTRIEDSKKIAKTLSAFANTDGGRLLIGVKDNGSVSGVDPQEEFHMIEAAAEMYCKPYVAFTTQIWKAEFRNILEVIIEPSKNRPHYALDESGDWIAYMRKNDNNLKVNGVMVKVWEHGKTLKPNDFKYTERERALFDYLHRRGKVAFKTASRITRLNFAHTEEMLAQLICWDVIAPEFDNGRMVYTLKPSDQ
ncbi:MAG: ATP-binding protein [Flavobacteriales bacterium]|nr:ATP-binding protein [Flavobacteriales bacterium]MDG1765587.1 ATP-binding protein [Flavobacteriales bacterium]